MKRLFSILFVALSCVSFGQVEADFDNLVKLAELYTTNVNATGDEFKTKAEELRTPGLDHIIDALIALGSADEALLTPEFLSKPSEQELQYWYVIREIHYNQNDVIAEPRPNVEVARETLAKEVDDRALLDNYYYRIRGGISKIHNTEDLSNIDIQLNEYNLESDTEKAILYFSITTALVQRFRVLDMMKNYEKLLEFAERLPTINGKPYYEYTAFDFEDFVWVGYNESESFKENHLGEIYQCLTSHFTALSNQKLTDEMRHLYFNSILSKPEYFQYAGEMKDDLQEIYDQSGK